MPLGQFANQTQGNCTAPLLDLATFARTGGYTAGRYCGLGSFGDGTTCCFPCPIQDWLYPSQWQDQLRVPNYLSILSVALCLFLLLSFAVLSPETTHRHYLSVGLLFSVLSISLSFAIPVSTDPDLCVDAITPHDMHTSTSCTATGSLVTLGGVGSVVWVFLRSLWLHIRIFWNRDPGRVFKIGSIFVGTVLPVVYLIAVLSVTGFSYRMGQTCLPNHEHAIVTFWIWLVIFAVVAFSPSELHLRVLLLRWRNILVSVFVIIGSISFFIVFWTQDAKLGRVFNDPKNIRPVKTWIICQTLSKGEKDKCRKYVEDFTVDKAAVLVSLILASLVGISIFILLFRTTMLHAWLALFRRLSHRALHRGRPPSLQLTSLENADAYQDPPHKVPSSFVTEGSTSSNKRSIGTELQSISKVDNRQMSEHGSSELGLLTPPSPTLFNTRPASQGTSLVKLPMVTLTPSTPISISHPIPRSPTHPHPSPHRLSQIQPDPTFSGNGDYEPSRLAPSPPSRTMRPSERIANSSAGEKTERDDGGSEKTEDGLKRTKSKVRGLISAPVPRSFVHVTGAFVEQDGRREGAV
ncbi:hypothetical protein BU23DRAFT_563979 [Bimuria novae-zelandiae CBS 107.79]|uniref:G-protein coupled receptors family 2 profile 2 domain-containing protein n=1 Tax=Bimuria novae-zelandiae CBS 107.79 TaxID=1447943 RepID=A0A6A5VNR4_9PLEO|nr:hypothetical protein BU23DRAFT_563979 [Bimuria novae-zelandiae CBS 107.79]